jgi:hypothetical protein
VITLWSNWKISGLKWVNHLHFHGNIPISIDRRKNGSIEQIGGVLSLRAIRPGMKPDASRLFIFSGPAWVKIISKAGKFLWVVTRSKGDQKLVPSKISGKCSSGRHLFQIFNTRVDRDA